MDISTQTAETVTPPKSGGWLDKLMLGLVIILPGGLVIGSILLALKLRRNGKR